MSKDNIKTIQYYLAWALLILFIIGLIPTMFDNVYPYINLILIVLIALSIFRLSFFGFFLEVLLLGLAFLSQIVLLGYIFRFIAIGFVILEILSHKTYILKNFSYVDINRKLNTDSEVKKTKAKKKRSFQDAKFKEK